MAVKKLLRMGDDRLIKPSKLVENIQDSDVQKVIEDMIDSMRHYGGVGIAAPQIGYFLRIFIIEVAANERYPEVASIPLTVFINPEIEMLTEEREEGFEGCLSVPGYRGSVPRYTHIRYTAYDREGVKIEGEAHSFHARVIQHEYDHVDGILFPMRIEDMSNFGCEDVFWERMTGKPYPQALKQKLREHWGL